MLLTGLHAHLTQIQQEKPLGHCFRPSNTDRLYLRSGERPWRAIQPNQPEYHFELLQCYSSKMDYPAASFDF